MYYSSQPIEIQKYKALERTFEIIDPENRPLYASDYSHRDFDLPSTIYDLPFLSEKAKHNMLGVRRLACSSCRRAMRSRERTWLSTEIWRRDAAVVLVS